MVEFKHLWRHHPINESVQSPCIAPRDMVVLGASVKQGFPAISNQCAIRMGIALKAAGVTPTQMGSLATCTVHPPDQMHYIRAQEVGEALGRVSIPGIGRVEKLVAADAKGFYPKLFGRTGIIFIQDYWYRNAQERAAGRPTGDHIDVWNGYRSSSKWLMEWFSWLGYYSNYAESREVWFWEVK